MTSYIYGIAYEGDDEFTFNRFKDLSSRKNKKYFFSRKVNSCDASCTGEEIKKAMKDSFVLGKPKLCFVDRPVSWLQVALSAYKEGIFTDDEGYQELEALSGSGSSDGGPCGSGSGSGSSGSGSSGSGSGGGCSSGSGSGSSASSVSKNGKNTAPNSSSVFERARLQARGLAMSDTDSFKANLSQGGKHLVVFPPPTTSCVEKDWDKLAKEELGRIIDEYKDKAIKAEDYSATLEQALAARDNRVLELDNRVLELENTVTALNDELEAARKAQAGFMAHGDMKTLEAEATRKASALLLDGLKPLIATEIQPVKTLLDSVASSVASSAAKIDTTCGSMGALHDDVTAMKSFASGNVQQLLFKMSAGSEASTELLLEIKSQLDEIKKGASKSPKSSPPFLNNLIPSIPVIPTQFTTPSPHLPDRIGNGYFAGPSGAVLHGQDSQDLVTLARRFKELMGVLEDLMVLIKLINVIRRNTKETRRKGLRTRTNL